MNIKVPDNLKDEIKKQNPIDEVLKDMYAIELNTSNKALCPFHKENTPSFEVRNHGATYCCYGCGAGGEHGQEITLKSGAKIKDAGNDVIGLIMNLEQVSYKEACYILATRVGITLPEYKIDPVLEQKKNDVTAKNREYYRALKQDQDALDYLYNRGITDDDIDKWRLGMVPWNTGNPRYAGRIVFGLSDIHWDPSKAKTIAMAYRVREFNDYVEHGFDLSTDEKVKKTLNPKYFNDKTSDIYKKQEYLYGLNEAQKGIRRERCVVMMEGYMDVITAHKNGLDNSVAACGTSITDGHVEVLRRYTDKVFIWLDGDEAGLSGAIRALPKFLKQGFKVMIVESPGLDPADVATQGVNLRQFMAVHAKPAVQLVIERVVSDYDKIVNKARTDALEELLPILDCIEQPAEKINFQSVVEDKLNVTL